MKKHPVQCASLIGTLHYALRELFFPGLFRAHAVLAVQGLVITQPYYPWECLLAPVQTAFHEAGRVQRMLLAGYCPPSTDLYSAR